MGSVPYASRSMVMTSFMMRAEAAIVTPMNKGRYLLLTAYSLPPKYPPDE